MMMKWPGNVSQNLMASRVAKLLAACVFGCKDVCSRTQSKYASSVHEDANRLGTSHKPQMRDAPILDVVGDNSCVYLVLYHPPLTPMARINAAGINCDLQLRHYRIVDTRCHPGRAT